MTDASKLKSTEQYGPSLLDNMAKAAMQAIYPDGTSCEVIAAEAYDMAVSMLNERQKRIEAMK